ncbi:aldolase [Methylosinus sp. R-45379]|uniref:aldolase/citrate lyase family protein n=1 Tax=unclassified Methylosinus TaxID=2624500 RepID=UPI00047AA35A|nr:MULTISPECIES: aldolase/citrate lyase family protein [unclassified Methylosinus]OAI24944.1 aldolase [Methylosinus sp. R-45379]TDX66905.1 citrate lyase subunit beta/citryl-CoA lyase [Methylosinus sp. sav-2]
MRSFLLVPPREEAFSAALASGADALALDLGDPADPARESMRRRAAALIERPRPPGLRLYALIAPLGAAIDADLAALVAAGVDGVFLPQACGGASVQHLSAKLAVAEAECGRADGATRIIALATQTPAAIFALSTYGGSSSRLEALAFDTEPLRRALGASPDGAAGPSAIARSLLLLGAAAAGVAAIDAPFADLADAAGLAAQCRAARQEGFAGKLALDPIQIPPINQTFAADAPAL